MDRNKLQTAAKACRADLMWLEKLFQIEQTTDDDLENAVYELKQSVYLLRKAAGEEQ